MQELQKQAYVLDCQILDPQPTLITAFAHLVPSNQTAGPIGISLTSPEEAASPLINLGDYTRG